MDTSDWTLHPAANLRVWDVAGLLQMKVEDVYRLVEAGELPAFFFSESGGVGIRESDVEAWLKAHVIDS
jgi:excisionase family DNA binding protein